MFWRIALAVLLAATIVDYAPIFIGKVPFPAQMVFDFPPFADLAPPGVPPPTANIGDLVTYFYPYRTIAARAVREGSIPLWNPYLQSGAPFLASPQSAVFYPPNFLYYVLPVSMAWAIGFPLRVLIAGWFTLLLVRRIGGSTAGSIVSGLLFAFCGFVTVWQGQAMADTAIWLPLICYSVVRLRSDPSGKSLAIAAIAFAMPVLAGHPETAAHLTLVGIALAVFLFFAKQEAEGSAQKPVRFAGFFTAAGILAIGAVAVQILPTLEWLGNMQRTLEVGWAPLPLWSMLAFVSRDILRASSAIGLQTPTQTAYIGMLAFIAAPVALLHSSRKLAIFIMAGIAAAITIAYGIGPLFWLTQHAPVLKFFKNERLIFVADFGVAVLAGLGITVLESLKPPERARRVRAAMLAAIGLVTAFSLIYAVHLLTLEKAAPLRVPRSSFIFLAASTLLVAWRLVGGLKGWRFPALAVGLVMIDVVTFAYGFISFVRPVDIFPPIELFERLKKDPQPFRIAELGDAYGANFETVYGLAEMGGYEIPLDRMKQFIQGLSEDEDMDSVELTDRGALEKKDRRIDMLNARYVMVPVNEQRLKEFLDRPARFKLLYTEGNTDVFENLHALPAAFFVPWRGVEIIANESAQLARVKDPSFDPERSVVVGGGVASAGQVSIPSIRAPATVEWVSKRTNSFHLKTVVPGSGMLVVSQMFYPGWTANVDGKRVSVVPADYALSAIPLSPGAHDITFSFMPLSFVVGLTLSILSVAVITLLFFGSRHTFRRRSGNPVPGPDRIQSGDGP